MYISKQQVDTLQDNKSTHYSTTQTDRRQTPRPISYAANGLMVHGCKKVIMSVSHSKTQVETQMSFNQSQCSDTPPSSLAKMQSVVKIVMLFIRNDQNIIS